MEDGGDVEVNHLTKSLMGCYAMLLLEGVRPEYISIEEQKQDAIDFALSKKAGDHACSRVRDGSSVFATTKEVVRYRRRISKFMETEFENFLEKVSSYEKNKSLHRL